MTNALFSTGRSEGAKDLVTNTTTFLFILCFFFRFTTTETITKDGPVLIWIALGDPLYLQWMVPAEEDCLPQQKPVDLQRTDANVIRSHYTNQTASGQTGHFRSRPAACEGIWISNQRAKLCWPWRVRCAGCHKRFAPGSIFLFAANEESRYSSMDFDLRGLSRRQVDSKKSKVLTIQDCFPL